MPERQVWLAGGADCLLIQAICIDLTLEFDN